jgi:hypothetical protein
MTMSKRRSASHLRLLFVLAVVIPCLILGVIAIRSINREKAFIELRLQRTLDAELVHMVSLVNSDLDRIREELASSLTGDESASPRDALAAWKTRSPLVGVPFLLSPIYRSFGLCRPQKKGLSDGELCRAAIPVCRISP